MPVKKVRKPTPTKPVKKVRKPTPTNQKPHIEGIIMPGYIVLDRAVMAHWVAEEYISLFCWVDILMRANYETKEVPWDGGFKKCERGQFITSLKKLVTRWGITKSQVRTLLLNMRLNNLISTHGSNQCTFITVCHYDNYQLNKKGSSTQDSTQDSTQNDMQVTRNLAPTKEVINKEINNSFIRIVKGLTAFIDENAKSKKTLPGGAAAELIAQAKEICNNLPKKETEKHNLLAPLILQARTKLSQPIVSPLFSYTEAELPELEKELLQSYVWLTENCKEMQNKHGLTINEEGIKLKIPEFIAVVRGQKKFPITLSEKKNHFKRWLPIKLNIDMQDQKKQKSYGKKAKTKTISKTEQTFQSGMTASEMVRREMQEISMEY